MAIGLLQGFGYYTLIKSYGLVESGSVNGIWAGIVIVLSFTAGSAFLMWLGEQITEFGIGNGISIILFAGIVSRGPQMVGDIYTGVTRWAAGLSAEELTQMGMSETAITAYQKSLLSELWSIFDYLMPGFLYGYDTFKKEFETPIVKNEDEAAMTRLQKMVSPFILRRLKEDVLKDLPEKLEEIRYVKFEDAQQKLYDAQVVHMKEKIAQQNEGEFNKNKLWILAELTKLRQICCSPSLCFENYRGEAAKLEGCMQLIQSAMDGGHRMLLFSQFTSMLAILQDKLEKEGIPYYIITGETSKQKRQELVKQFNSDTTPVFLISLKAGGVGLNLTGADVVIHYDPWWNQAVQNQATDRAHRIGQTKKVTVYKLIARNTIEEKIQKLQDAKQNLAEQIISGDMGQLGSMSREDILELL